MKNSSIARTSAGVGSRPFLTSKEFLFESEELLLDRHSLFIGCCIRDRFFELRERRIDSIKVTRRNNDRFTWSIEANIAEVVELNPCRQNIGGADGGEGFS